MHTQSAHSLVSTLCLSSKSVMQSLGSRLLCDNAAAQLVCVKLMFVYAFAFDTCCTAACYLASWQSHGQQLKLQQLLCFKLVLHKSATCRLRRQRQQMQSQVHLQRPPQQQPSLQPVQVPRQKLHQQLQIKARRRQSPQLQQGLALILMQKLLPTAPSLMLLLQLLQRPLSRSVVFF